MYLVVNKDPLTSELDVIECSTPQEVEKKTIYLDHEEYVVVSGEILKHVHDTVVKKKGLKRWIGIK